MCGKEQNRAWDSEKVAETGSFWPRRRLFCVRCLVGGRGFSSPNLIPSSVGLGHTGWLVLTAADSVSVAQAGTQQICSSSCSYLGNISSGASGAEMVVLYVLGGICWENCRKSCAYFSKSLLKLLVCNKMVYDLRWQTLIGFPRILNETGMQMGALPLGRWRSGMAVPECRGARYSLFLGKFSRSPIHIEKQIPCM